MAKILICDDDKEIVKSIKIYLTGEGFETVCCFNGAEALRAAKDEDIKCIIMDIMMPFMDGIKATEKIREFSQVPIIFLSAKSEDEDKIIGLGYGADDYVTKPFSPPVLIARVKAQVRRFTAYSAEKSSDVLSTGALSLDRTKKEVTLDGEAVRLTATEYGILEYLMLNMGKLISSDRIYNEVWGQDAIAGDKTVTVHIRRIREKIEADPGNPVYLKVVWGLGYKIEKI